MQLNVSQQLKSAIGSSQVHRLNDTIDITGKSHPNKVWGELKLTRTDRGILVAGQLFTDTEATCSRCLRRFHYPLVLDIEEEYFPSIDTTSGLPLSLPDEPGCFTIDKHHILNLTEAIQQYTLMATPMKALCQPDCAGLCPICGHNLNQGDCGCRQPQTDERWASLKVLTANHRESKIR